MRRPPAVTRISIAILLVAGQLSAQSLDPPPPPAQNPGASEQARIDELERRVRELESRLRELEAAAPKPAAPAAALAAPAPREAAPPSPRDTTPAPQAVRSLGPPTASDEASFASRTGPISGYMDFHLNKPENEDPILDFHRFVLLFNHSFTDRLRFVGELELEHAFVAGLEPSGEVELEQAYLDFRLKPAVNLRAGMLLAPVGIINERHEPPAFFGVERPFVDTFIIPTTWFDSGAGVHGPVGAGWQYRAYVMAPLDATKITAEEGLHEATQKGFESNVRNVAGTGRLEYVGVPGLNLGTSFWRGKTGFNFPRGDSRIGLLEFDGRYRAGHFAARGEFAQVFIDGAAELNDFQQRTTGVNPNIASQMRGFYLEPSLRPLPWIRADIGAFVRYENFDTQFKMPPGVLPLKQFDRAAWIVGGSYYPDPDVVVKIDYSIVRNRSSLFHSVDGFNVGLGWWF
jgi:hypothetical protein